MAWVKSATNGNVFEVLDEDLVRQLEAAGHEVHDTDPRTKRAKGAKASK